MTLAVAEALSPNKPNLDMTLAVCEELSPNKPNLDMTLAVGEELSPNKPNLDMTLAVAEALSLTKPNPTKMYFKLISDELGLHRMENPSNSEHTVSLHLYSPPFGKCKTFDERTGHCNQVEVTFWSKYGERTPYTTVRTMMTKLMTKE